MVGTVRPSVEESDRLYGRDVEALTATHVLAHHDVVFAKHVERALAKRARSRSSARGGRLRFLVRTIQLISYSAAWWQCGQLRFAGFLSGRSSKNSRSSIKAAASS